MKTTPLVLVFYIDRETMKVRDIIEPFIESINMYIESKDYEVMALFLPTDENERVECINPVIATQEQLDKIMERQKVSWGLEIQAQLSWFIKKAVNLKIIKFSKDKNGIIS